MAKDDMGEIAVTGVDTEYRNNTRRKILVGNAERRRRRRS